MTKIYTKQGDQGETSLIGGQRLVKSNERIELYGTVDELNAFIGKLLTVLELNLHDSNHSDELKRQVSQLKSTQRVLFNLGSQLACLKEDREKYQLPEITNHHVETIEKEIDHLDKFLTPLKNFILPGGTQASSESHICRVVCRRLERMMVAFNKQGDIPDTSIAFINRLSDYFFVSARFFNFCYGIEDVLWTANSEN